MMDLGCRPLVTALADAVSTIENPRPLRSPFRALQVFLILGPHDQFAPCLFKLLERSIDHQLLVPHRQGSRASKGHVSPDPVTTAQALPGGMKRAVALAK